MIDDILVWKRDHGAWNFIGTLLSVDGDGIIERPKVQVVPIEFQIEAVQCDYFG